MSIDDLLSLKTLLVIVVASFVLGAAPVFVVRLIALIYPSDDGRRKELLAEMNHVKKLRHVPETWRWLGQMFAVAVCEGIAERSKSVRRRAGIRAWPVTIGDTYSIYQVTEKIDGVRATGPGDGKTLGMYLMPDPLHASGCSWRGGRCPRRLRRAIREHASRAPGTTTAHDALGGSWIPLVGGDGFRIQSIVARYDPPENVRDRRLGG